MILPTHFSRYPWLGFKEESVNGALRHMKSETTFPGTYSVIDSRSASQLEGLTMIINPDSNKRVAAPPVSDLRFPFCQLEEI